MEADGKAPAELRTLIAFLSIDDRPTTILHWMQEEHRDERHLRAVYSNSAFQRLPIFDAELESIRNVVTRTLSIDDNLAALHGAYLDERSWQTRVSGEYCIVTAIARAVEAGDEVRGKGRPPSSVTGLDWTRADRPGLSPWVQYIRSFDWSSTSFGPISSWCDDLRLYVLSMMSNPQPRLIVWGEGMGLMYNEHCLPVLGAKHPDCLGQDIRTVFAEAWSEIGPLIEAGFQGQVHKIDNFPLPLLRRGFLEESYWSFTLLPIIDRGGNIRGVYDELTETTSAVTGQRRRSAVNQLGMQLNKISTSSELWSTVLEQMTANELDVPFAILYTVDADPSLANGHESDSDGAGARPKRARLAGTVGLPTDDPVVLQSFTLEDGKHEPASIFSACIEAWKSGRTSVLTVEDATLPPALALSIPGRGFGDPVKTVTVSPIKATASSETLAFLVWGLNPRSVVLGGEYQTFRQVLVDIMSKAAALIQLPQEQQRAQKLAEDVNHALAQQLRLTTLKAEKSEATFKRLASVSPTGMFIIDIDGRPLYANEQYLDMLDITQEGFMSIVGFQGLVQKVHDDDVERYLQAWTTMTEHKTPIAVEFRLRKPRQRTDHNGQEMETWLLATAFPEIETDGTVSFIQGWLTDISHRKHNEQLLSQRLEDALENKRATENFIDMTSHEMRNPLSAILQSADSIESLLNLTEKAILDENVVIPTHVAEDIMDAAQTIILCAQHQKRIVDDILTLSKLDASLLVMVPDKVQVPSLVTKALKMYEAEIGRAGIDAQLCIEPTYDELGVDWVILDPSRLLQVIINLLTNSIKFTQYSEQRKIKICIGASYQRPTGKHHGISFIETQQVRTPRTCSEEWTEGEDVYLQFAVYDTGRGLTEDEMKLLFQRFCQASPKTYKQYGGSGLGLYISRELCELQGGQIGVSSGNGQTVFTFYVKAKRLAEAEQEIGGRPVPLRYASAAASPVAYSKEGSTAMNNQPDQLGSPREENSNEIENFYPRQQPLASQQSFDTRKDKPMFYTSQVLTEKDATDTVDPALHVLVVEDNLINQKVMSQQLTRAGCIVHVANHGLECLSFLEKSTYCLSETPLSVILLDLEMPEMDGLTCIRHIRKKQANGSISGHVPVIAVTANARAEQISIAIEAGMDQVVTKPFRIPELVPQMQKLVADIAAAHQRTGG